MSCISIIRNDTAVKMISSISIADCHIALHINRLQIVPAMEGKWDFTTIEINIIIVFVVQCTKTRITQSRKFQFLWTIMSRFAKFISTKSRMNGRMKNTQRHIRKIIIEMLEKCWLCFALTFTLSLVNAGQEKWQKYDSWQKTKQKHAISQRISRFICHYHPHILLLF